MRVLLIDPPGIEGLPVGRVLGSFGINKADQLWPPYDLQVFAGYLKRFGHDFRIIDANNLKLTLQDIRKEIVNFRPDWVIYLTCFQTFELDARIAKLAKEISNNIKTSCMSLSIFSVEEPEEAIARHPYLDYLLWGEPEVPLMRLINGEVPMNVKGIYFREGERVFFTGEAERIKDLDELGIPVHEGMPFHIYRCPLAKRRPLTIVNCSRGCINWCIHCQAGAFQRPIRYRSVESVMEELRQVNTLGIREIKFYDCSLPTKRNFAIELSENMLKEGLRFTWHCNARADRIDKELLKVMKRAGCHTISIGCESANDEILRNMRKNETVEQIESAVRLVKESGMRVLMYFTFGLPGETEETMKKTYEFVRRLMPDYVTFGIVVPAPGTPFYMELKERGYLVPKELHWQDPTALPSFNYPHLSRERIYEFARESYRRYYFSAPYILKRLFSITTLDEFLSSFSNALSIMKRYVFGGRH